MYLYNVKCDICGKSGTLNQGWRILRDFAYVKHACPKCVNETDDYGGSYYRDLRLSAKIRSTLRERDA